MLRGVRRAADIVLQAYIVTMNHTPPPLPSAATLLVPFVRAILDINREQAAMRELYEVWSGGIAQGRYRPDDPALAPVAELIAGFGGYEPNPQFCNTDAGMYDWPELQRRVKETLAKLGYQT